MITLTDRTPIFVLYVFKKNEDGTTSTGTEGLYANADDADQDGLAMVAAKKFDYYNVVPRRVLMKRRYSITLGEERPAF